MEDSHVGQVVNAVKFFAEPRGVLDRRRRTGDAGQPDGTRSAPVSLASAASFLRRARSISQTTTIDTWNRPNSGPAISSWDSTSGPGVSTPPTIVERISAYLLNFQRPFAVTNPSQPRTARTTGSSKATPVPSSIAIMKPTTSSIFTIGSIEKGSVPVNVSDSPKRN